MLNTTEPGGPGGVVYRGSEGGQGGIGRDGGCPGRLYGEIVGKVLTELDWVGEVIVVPASAGDRAGMGTDNVQVT